jgi:hypothetical protein
MANEKPMVTDRKWFNPVNVIYEFKRLESLGILKPSVIGYKKIQEAYISAISLIGMVEALKIDFWLQIVDDSEGSPDIKTICFSPKGASNEFTIQDVEIVIFGNHSSDNIVQFLLDTKLSKRKGYDDLTNILCFVDKIAYLPSVQEIRSQLINRG